MSNIIKSAWTYGSEVITNMFSRVSPQKYGNSYFYSAQYNAWNELDHLKAFLDIPELNAVISTKARMFGNGVIKEVNDNGEEVKSALVDILNNPNWMQGGKEFMRQTKLFNEIFGNEYLYELFPVGFDFESARSKALFTIPGNWMIVKYNDDQPFFNFVEMPESVRYSYKYRNTETRIPNDLLIHINADRVNMQGSYIMKGQSKLVALTPALNNLKMAYETRGVLLKNRGAMGILSNATSDKIGAIPLDPVEKDRVQDEYSNYGGLKGQRQLIITSADLRWQQMTISPDKMGLYAETAEDFNKILDAYGLPSELFVRTLGATYENQKEARKGAYIDTIIPEANEWIGAFNSKHRQGAKTKLIIDYLHLPIFADDLKKRGESLTAMTNALSKALQDGAITIEQYMEELEKFGIKKQTTL